MSVCFVQYLIKKITPKHNVKMFSETERSAQIIYATYVIYQIIQ